MSRVAAAQRFTAHHPCPVCGGYDGLPRGEGVRCAGFRSEDGRWAHCTREEHAGGLRQHVASLTYAHRLDIPCRCGRAHDAAPPRALPPASNGNAPAAQRGALVATYDYWALDGRVMHRTLRYEPKEFRQCRPDPDRPGGWIQNLDGVTLVLYRLPEIQGHADVVLVEGEKDAEALAALGFAASCNPMGAGKWRATYAQQLVAAGARRVAVLPDNDRPGQNHAAAVASSCLAAGLTASVVPLPGLPPAHADRGEDVSVWLAQGHTPDELRAVLAAAWAKASELAAVPGPAPVQGFEFRAIGELLAQPDTPLEWLVDGLLPREAISLLVGRPKSGKTTLCRTLAADVVGGSAFLGRPTERGAVIYVSLEDSGRAVTAHFRRLGVSPDAPLYVVCAQAPPDALQILRREVEQRRPALVVIDTLYRFTKVRDVAAYGEVTAALQPLLTLQRELQFHLLLVHHSPKGADSTRDAIDAGLGSTALPGTVDLALFLRCFPDGRRTLCSSPRSECGDPLPETVVILDQDTGRPGLGGTRQAADEAAAAEDILEYLAGQTAPVEESDIHEAVEGRKRLKVRALRQLVKDEKVTRTGEGRRGAPFLYAVSSSLVPAYIREPENQKPGIALNQRPTDVYSGSRGNGHSPVEADYREPEFLGAEGAGDSQPAQPCTKGGDCDREISAAAPDLKGAPASSEERL
jgi:hypothetical protein